MTDSVVQDTQPGSQLIIAGEDIPFGAYQAIYHSLTKKVEQRSKAYKTALTITFADVQNLHSRLSQAIKQYSVKSARCQVTHQFSDETAREHSSFERFRLSDMLTRSATSQITYEFDFLIVLPAEIPSAREIAQRYKVMVMMEQDNLEEDLDQLFLIRSFTRQREVNMLIEYADYAVSQALYSVVDGWVSSLPVTERGRFSKAIGKLEAPLRLYTSSVARIATLFGGAYAVYRAVSVREALFGIMVFFGLSVLFETLAGAFVSRAFESLARTRPMPTLLVTQGDQDRLEIVGSKQRRRRSATQFMFFGVLLTVTLSILSNVIYDVLKRYVL